MHVQISQTFNHLVLDTASKHIKQCYIVFDFRYLLDQIVFQNSFGLRAIHNIREGDQCQNTQNTRTFKLAPQVLDGLIKHVAFPRWDGKHRKVVPPHKPVLSHARALLTLKVELTLPVGRIAH